MKSSKQKEALRRRADVLTLFLLLAVGVTLIVYSIAVQDEEVLRDMEEYAALAEQVQSMAEQQSVSDSREETPHEQPAVHASLEETQRTAMTDGLSESMEAAAEIIRQMDSTAHEEAGSQESTPGTIIVVIPAASTAETVATAEQQTVSENDPVGVNIPGKTKPSGATNPPKETQTASPEKTPAPAIEPSPTPLPRIGKTGVDLDACHAANGDFVAWLTIPGTKINYPVVWSDRVDYYLTHTFSGKESKIGTLFSLRKTDYLTPSRNIAVYGHHITTSGGNMFQPLTLYKKQSFYEKHKTVYFDTLYDLGEYTIFAVVNMKDTDWDASAASFDSDRDFLAFVNRARAASLYDTGVEVNADDFILTLITCDREYHNPDGRLIVMAVKQ